MPSVAKGIVAPRNNICNETERNHKNPHDTTLLTRPLSSRHRHIGSREVLLVDAIHDTGIAKPIVAL